MSSVISRTFGFAAGAIGAGAADQRDASEKHSAAARQSASARAMAATRRGGRVRTTSAGAGQAERGALSRLRVASVGQSGQAFWPLRLGDDLGGPPLRDLPDRASYPPCLELVRQRQLQRTRRMPVEPRQVVRAVQLVRAGVPLCVRARC